MCSNTLDGLGRTSTTPTAWRFCCFMKESMGTHVVLSQNIVQLSRHSQDSVLASFSIEGKVAAPVPSTNSLSLSTTSVSNLDVLQKLRQAADCLVFAFGIAYLRCPKTQALLKTNPGFLRRFATSYATSCRTYLCALFACTFIEHFQNRE